MKAILVREFGAPEVLKLEEIPTPQPAAGQVLVRVKAAGGTQKGLDLAKREGAHQVFDHTKSGYQDAILRSTGGRGVDIILEMLANMNLGADLKLLATNGRVIVIGSRGDVPITPRDLMIRRASVRAFTLWGATETEAKLDWNGKLLAGDAPSKESFLISRCIRSGRRVARSSICTRFIP